MGTRGVLRKERAFLYSARNFKVFSAISRPLDFARAVGGNRRWRLRPIRICYAVPLLSQRSMMRS
jgi:hypothetical protein